MTVAAAVKPVKETTLVELSTAFLDNFHICSFGTPAVEAGNMIGVTITIKNPLGTTVPCVERLRLTCSTGATMALKPATGKGTVLQGTGTDDMIIETDVTTGTFDLEVTDAAAETITVVAGVTQGSGVCACQQTVDCVFTNP